MTITIKFQISKLQEKEEKTATYWQPVRILNILMILHSYIEQVMTMCCVQK